VKIGPYELQGELGRGGMGVVYRVRLPSGGEGALKVLPKLDPSRAARFERERRLLAALGERAGFVGLLDGGITGDGAWLLMPLVTGGTLRERLCGGALDVSSTLALGTEIARALGAAHSLGIVHRDVKPENILFTQEGRALLADLGLAKHFDRLAPGASRSVSQTAAGDLRGTAGYLAPEQLEDASKAGPPADVFALGAVLYECLAGRPAFPGATVLEMLARAAAADLAPIGSPSVPAWLEAVLRRSLAREPKDRFANGEELARALELQGKVPESARPRRTTRALPLVAALLVAGIALTLAARTPTTLPDPIPGTPPARPLPTLVPGDAETPAAAQSVHAAIDSALAALERGSFPRAKSLVEQSLRTGRVAPAEKARLREAIGRSVERIADEAPTWSVVEPARLARAFDDASGLVEVAREIDARPFEPSDRVVELALERWARNPSIPGEPARRDSGSHLTAAGLDLVDRVLRLAPVSTTARAMAYPLGTEMTKASDIPRALALIDDASRIDSSIGILHLARGRQLQDHDRDDARAREELEKALAAEDLEPRDRFFASFCVALDDETHGRTIPALDRLETAWAYVPFEVDDGAAQALRLRLLLRANRLEMALSVARSMRVVPEAPRALHEAPLAIAAILAEPEERRQGRIDLLVASLR
jgi:serine/threonine-protein kinase